MFSIYGLSGPTFKGTLEALSGSGQATRVRRPRAVNRITEDDSVNPVYPGALLPAVQHEEAVNAYQEMLHPDLERGPLYHARQVMSSPVISVRTDDAVAGAWRILREQHIHQAPVLDASGSLVGIVSERDLLTALDIDGDRLIESLRRQVRDVMTTPIVAAEPLTDIRRIAAVMLDHDVAGVPIVTDVGQLEGFISRSDILRAVVTDPPLSLWR
jgi:CBS domain-containing protein